MLVGDIMASFATISLLYLVLSNNSIWEKAVQEVDIGKCSVQELI